MLTLKRLTTDTTKILNMIFDHAVMSNAANLMIAAFATIVVSFYSAYRNAAQVIIASRPGRAAKGQHHLSPFFSVGLDAMPSKQVVHHIVGNFMRNGLCHI